MNAFHDWTAGKWGQQQLRKNRIYKGYIVFAWSAFGGDLVVLDADFKGLPDSPWLFDAIHEFAFQDMSDLKEGAVYRFDGTFRNYEFNGTRTVIYEPMQDGGTKP